MRRVAFCKRLEEYIKRGVIPIAFNVFGDRIVIGVKEANFGMIYFMYHDKPGKIELAKQFKEFIEKCKSKKIGHIRSIEERKEAMIKNGLGDKITEYSIQGWQAEIDKYKNIHQEEVVL